MLLETCVEGQMAVLLPPLRFSCSLGIGRGSGTSPRRGMLSTSLNRRRLRVTGSGKEPRHSLCFYPERHALR